MNIGLIAVDSTFPNLALMKIARCHRDRGDAVSWYTPFDHYTKSSHNGNKTWHDGLCVDVATDFKDFSPRIGFKCIEYF